MLAPPTKLFVALKMNTYSNGLVKVKCCKLQQFGQNNDDFCQCEYFIGSNALTLKIRSEMNKKQLQVFP